MPQPEAESPQLRRERLAGVVAAALVCVALPSVVLLVSDTPTRAERDVAVSWFVGSFAAGAFVPLLHWSRFRALGFATYFAPVWLAAVAWCVVFVHGAWPAWVHGVPLGVIAGALARGRRGPQPAEETTAVLFSAVVGAGVAWLFVSRGPPFDVAGYFVLVLALLLVGWAATQLFRPWLELNLEPLVWVGYDVRARGPGLVDFPRTGPCLVIANHACWMDPGFLGKVLPRPTTPMMTATFYDLPVMRRIMVAFGVIRVPEKAMKRDASELQEAVAALDRGECVVIFPEGYLRRTEEQPLRRYGQGVWQILKARPNTPVFACWIEGGWGSYMSYFNGKPTKNKPRDVRRPIQVGVSEGETVPTDVLTEHLKTRIYLMNRTIASRAHLDLPELPRYEVPAKGEDKTDETEPVA